MFGIGQTFYSAECMPPVYLSGNFGYPEFDTQTRRFLESATLQLRVLVS